MSEMLVDSAANARNPPAASAPPGYSRLRRLPVFDGIPNEALLAAITAGGIISRRARRDEFVADPSSAATGTGRIAFVVEGQVAAAVFGADDLAARLQEQARYELMTEEQRRELSSLAPEPLARVAKKNLALFMHGDLFNAGAIPQSGGEPIALYACEPSLLAEVSHATIAEFAVQFPFFEARVRRAVQVSRDRLSNLVGVKQEMLDFFVRQGISVSGDMVRVRQLDRCIDCKQCEMACEERYGARRLTLGGYQLGMLDFVFTCRTCADQRCIDPCEYDSIKFDAELGEVVINEASCTGCTLCAQSCPYQAIEMVDVEDPQNPTYREGFKIRIDAAGGLAFGPGKPRVARARRIANKCDHCQTYADQACVSACPTGSLVELSAYELFRERSAESVALAKSGYDQEIGRSRGEILPTDPFTKGVGIRDGGKARMRRGKWGPVILWGVALAVWFLAVVEILLRTYSPAESLAYFLLRNDGYPIAIALDKTAYTPGTELALWCGFIGTGLMIISAVYPIWRRVPLFRLIASNSMWFDFHMMAGVVGPMFILLHSAFVFEEPIASGAFWTMVIVVVSGVMGRYLYTQVPDLMNGRELEELDHERAFVRLKSGHALATSECENELARHRAGVDVISEKAGMIRALIWILAEDLRRPGRWWRRRRRLKRTGAPRKLRKELSRRTARQLIIQRRRVLAPRAELLLDSWKKVHVPFTVVLTLFSTVHIWMSWHYV